ncbi:MAG: hypothetical protein SVU32_05685 [Candidatus Nanohaloarchaea archaeon]|nr:hypothetical protein [Candidatus Nanohaloarchaea archaeon]
MSTCIRVDDDDVFPELAHGGGEVEGDDGFADTSLAGDDADGACAFVLAEGGVGNGILFPGFMCPAYGLAAELFLLDQSLPLQVVQSIFHMVRGGVELPGKRLDGHGAVLEQLHEPGVITHG